MGSYLVRKTLRKKKIMNCQFRIPEFRKKAE